MPLREFTDAERRTWQVWDTVPKSPSDGVVFARSAQLLADAERRRRDEVSGGEADAAHRASDADRALAAAALRRFTEGREHGWLTFMQGDEKRRLSPIPEGWQECDDAGLAALLVRAEPVAKSHREGSGV